MPPPSQVMFSTKGARAHSDAALDHVPSSTTGNRALSVVPPSRGSNLTMGSGAPNPVPSTKSLRFARSSQPRVAQEEGCGDYATPSYPSGFVSTSS